MVSSVMYEDVDRADHMISALSRMLRLSLDEGAAAETPLRREIEFLEAANELLRARFQDRIDIEIVCPTELLEAPVPHLVLHTLVENAIKHHQGEPDPVIRVRVQVEADAGVLHLHVIDNGPGIPDQGAAFGKGVGLANTRARLKALYGDRFTFELNNRPEGGLHVHVSIPLNIPVAGHVTSSR
jgi:LytS/YehU family sensor histidine kinase